MQNAPFIRLFDNTLELWYWFPDSIGHKIGYQFYILTQDDQLWRMEVCNRATCGMSTRLGLRILNDNVTAVDFIRSACTTMSSQRLVKSVATLLETDGSYLLKNPKIEIQP